MLNSGLFNKLRGMSESKGKYMDSPDSIKVGRGRGVGLWGDGTCWGALAPQGDRGYMDSPDSAKVSQDGREWDAAPRALRLGRNLQQCMYRCVLAHDTSPLPGRSL